MVHCSFVVLLRNIHVFIANICFILCESVWEWAGFRAMKFFALHFSAERRVHPAISTNTHTMGAANSVNNIGGRNWAHIFDH